MTSWPELCYIHQADKMTKISINGKTYAVVASELLGGKTSCDQCAFQEYNPQREEYFCGYTFVDCQDYDTEETHYHFEEVNNV